MLTLSPGTLRRLEDDGPRKNTGEVSGQGYIHGAPKAAGLRVGLLAGFQLARAGDLVGDGRCPGHDRRSREEMIAIESCQDFVTEERVLGIVHGTLGLGAKGDCDFDILYACSLRNSPAAISTSAPSRMRGVLLSGGLSFPS